MNLKEILKPIKEFPGPLAKQWLERHKKVAATTTVCSEFVPEKGKGIILWDKDGNAFIDCNSGVGVNSLGHEHKPSINAVCGHLRQTGISQYIEHDFVGDAAVMLKEKLVEITPGDFAKKVYLTVAGANANEAAVKLCFSKRPDREIGISFRRAFHGRTGYVLPLTRRAVKHYKGYPHSYATVYFDFPYTKSCGQPDIICGCEQRLKRQFLQHVKKPHEINFWILELIQGEGGIYPLCRKAAKTIQKICKDFDIMLIVDEIQTGMGRTGKMFACEHYGLEPDIITVAKAFGGGLPAAAAVFRADLDFEEKGRHSDTFGGNATCCVAALATLRELTESNLLNPKRVAEIENIFRKRLEKLENDFYSVANARGLGFMWGFDIVRTNGELWPEMRSKIVEQGYFENLILMGAGKSAIRLMPPIIIKPDELHELFDRLEKAIDKSITKYAKTLL